MAAASASRPLRSKTEGYTTFKPKIIKGKRGFGGETAFVSSQSIHKRPTSRFNIVLFKRSSRRY
ncbi:UNVERIFIED_CONTAM: hypothetical protein Sindi_2130700 [Sesamum indicum]